MNQSDENTLSSLTNISDEDIKIVVEQIYKENDGKNIKEKDLIVALKVKLRISLNDNMPDHIVESAKRYLEEIINTTADTSLYQAKHHFMNEIILTVVKGYNATIATVKGKESDLCEEFRKIVDSNGEIDNTILDSTFSSLYNFYNKKKIPQNEIDDVKRLSIANIIEPSKFKKTLNAIFCCGRKSKYRRRQEIFIANIKEILKLAMAVDKSSINDLSNISEGQNENFVGSFKAESLFTKIIRDALQEDEKDKNDNFLDELENEDQAQLIRDESYKQYIKSSGDEVTRRF